MFPISPFLPTPTEVRSIVFAAQRATMPSSKIVHLYGKERLYLLDVPSGKVRELAHSEHDLYEPKFLDSNTVVFVDHDTRTRHNVLYTVDLKTGRKIRRVTARDGRIDRIEVLGDGHFVFLHYRPSHPDDALNGPKWVDVFHDFHPYFTPKKELTDATLDADERSILAVSPDRTGISSILGQANVVSTPAMMNGHVRNVAYGNHHAVVFGMLSDDQFPLLDRTSTGTQSITATFPESKGDGFGPLFFWNSSWDGYYPTELRYDKPSGRFLFIAVHEMSDSWHRFTFSLDLSAKKILPVCTGVYIGAGPRSSMIVLNNPWVGEYKRGGARMGRLFLTTKDVNDDAKALTSKRLDVSSADART